MEKDSAFNKDEKKSIHKLLTDKKELQKKVIQTFTLEEVYEFLESKMFENDKETKEVLKLKLGEKALEDIKKAKTQEERWDIYEIIWHYRYETSEVILKIILDNQVSFDDLKRIYDEACLKNFENLKDVLLNKLLVEYSKQLEKKGWELGNDIIPYVILSHDDMFRDKFLDIIITKAKKQKNTADIIFKIFETYTNNYGSNEEITEKVKKKILGLTLEEMKEHKEKWRSFDFNYDYEVREKLLESLLDCTEDIREMIKILGLVKGLEHRGFGEGQKEKVLEKINKTIKDKIRSAKKREDLINTIRDLNWNFHTEIKSKSDLFLELLKRSTTLKEIKEVYKLAGNEEIRKEIIDIVFS